MSHWPRAVFFYKPTWEIYWIFFDSCHEAQDGGILGCASVISSSFANCTHKCLKLILSEVVVTITPLVLLQKKIDVMHMKVLLE